MLLLVVAAGLGTAYAWTRTQYFVGAAGDHVAIYQGLSEGVPGINLSRVYEVQQLTMSELPPYYQEKVRANIDVDSLDSARETVLELTEYGQALRGSEAGRRAVEHRQADGTPQARTASPPPSPAPNRPRRRPARPPASAEPNC